MKSCKTCKKNYETCFERRTFSKLTFGRSVLKNITIKSAKIITENKQPKNSLDRDYIEF